MWQPILVPFLALSSAMLVSKHACALVLKALIVLSEMCRQKQEFLEGGCERKTDADAQSAGPRCRAGNDLGSEISGPLKLRRRIT